MNNFKNMLAGLLSLVLLASCGNGGSTEKKNSDQKEITIGYVNWTEGIAMTHIAQEILQNQGYKVKLKNASVNLIYTALAQGDVDIFMDNWLPFTHIDKVNKVKDKVSFIGVNYDAARIGLVVPEYVDINSVEELNGVKAKFDGKIIGVEKSAGLTGKTNSAIKEYGLDFKQMNSSSAAMAAELTKAIKNKEWIVVTGWAPHWKFGRFQLKFLEDPKKIFGETEHIETYSRLGFAEDDAFATNFFKNFHLTAKEMAVLIDTIENSDDKAAAAKSWVQDHQELVNTWLRQQ